MNITIFLSVSTVLVILYSVQATAISDQNKTMMQCVVKLMPCRLYVNSGVPPPSWCCDPLKEIVEDDVSCLCEAFKHPDMLALIHLDQEGALNLISSCGASYDASRCDDAVSPSAALTAGSTTSGSSSARTSKNAAIAMSLLGFSFVSAFTGL